MDDEYHNLVATIDFLRDDPTYIHILMVLAELMFQMKDKHLKTAQYTQEFIYDRLKVRIIIEKENKNG